MKRNLIVAAVIGFVMLTAAMDVHAEKWVKNNFDIPNENLEANYHDSDSVKTHKKTISWTEKFNLTSLGEKSYSKHLMQYPECLKNIEKKGNVTYHKNYFEIKEGKFRIVARRNYNKSNELVCSDKDMGTEIDKKWNEIQNKSPMSERYYMFVTKYNVGNL